MDGYTKTSDNQTVAEKGFRYSTFDVPARDRRDWLQEVIRQEYTKVEVTPPVDGDLFNEMTFYTWEKLRLSVIRSHAITIERLRSEPHFVSQDNYLAVVLLSGSYLLEQNGRETFLQPGDMAIYDATRPHRIQCSRNFSKLIVSIPRAIMRDRIAGAEYCTALRIPGSEGIGFVATNFIRSVTRQAETMNKDAFSALSDHYLDLLTLSLASVRPQDFSLSRSRSISLNQVKDFVERYLSNSAMDTTMIATGVRLSPRYINDLFSDEGTSLMRYVWKQRLENCRKDMLNPAHIGYRISDIAFRWGFNDLSHFSRAFKQQFEVSPREVK
ncbi:MAG: helix-turn-helix domain-containing protein [Methylotenera sp.]|nr:helix-turn-helix domain-containing protein [Methylotenera sp.]